MEENPVSSPSNPRGDNVSKEEKLKCVVHALKNITNHLFAYLPIANAHMTDFIVKDHWTTHVTETIRSELLDLSPTDLTLLPSGRLYAEHLTEVVDSVDGEASSESLVICGDKLSVLKGEKCKWDPDVLPSWHHVSLREFVTSCQRNSVQYCGLMKRVTDVLQTENQDDLVPIIEFMSVKKSHEVEIMTELCGKLCRQHDISHMIDLGSGKGYLGSHLALKHSLRVLGIDSSQTNTAGAADRSERLDKQWTGLVSRSQRRKDGGGGRARRTRRAKVHVEELEDTTVNGEKSDHAVARCGSKNRGIFAPVTQFVDKTTDLQELLHNFLEKTCEIDGLETSAEDTGKSMHVTKSISPSFNATSACDDSDVETIPGMSLTTNPIPFMIGGLHACGDLTSNTLRLFIENPQARVLCGVGCCYHHLTEAFLKCPFGKDEGLSVEEVGFPLSDHLRSRGCQLGRNARMVASQAPDRMADAGKPPSVSLFWRALLQVILRDLTGEIRDDWQVGRIAAKCPDFSTYVKMALDKLGIEHKLTEENIQDYETQYADHERRVQCFVQLKSSLAPCIEATILLDRLCFLLEQECVGDAEVVQLFDPLTSPRCYALVAWK